MKFVGVRPRGIYYEKREDKVPRGRAQHHYRPLGWTMRDMMFCYVKTISHRPTPTKLILKIRKYP